MNTRYAATIIGLSPGVHAIIQNAVTLLQSANQDLFFFESGASIELPYSPSPETPRLWSELEAVLVAERKRRNSEYLVGVLDEPIENNWFSHTAYGKNVAWITAHDWEYYSNLPVASFVAYDIVQNLVLLQLITRPEDEKWLMGEVIHTGEPRECLSDLCAFKPDISRKIRSGKICHDCQRIIERRRGPEFLAAICILLGKISSVSLPTEPGPAAIPVLNRMEQKARGLFKSSFDRACQKEKALIKVLREAEAYRDDIKAEIKKPTKIKNEPDAYPTAINARDSAQNEETRVANPEIEPSFSVNDDDHFDLASVNAESFSLERSGLPEKIGSRYPFPIAYCFRSMQAELNPTDRWNILFELYGLIIRYMVFALLSDLRKQQTTCPDPVKLLIQKLKFGFAGDWGRACISLLKVGQNIRGQAFLQGFLNTLTPATLDRLETLSIRLVKTRNAMEHGYRGDKDACQKNFERHLPDIKTLLQFIEPLANYILIRPAQIIDNLDGECLYISKVMAGSDPQFLPRKIVSSSVPETVCQLLSPEGSTLTMHPWLHLNRCSACLRDMVFVYDAIHVKGGQEIVLLREYPSNHEQREPALLVPVKRMLNG
jgi:hypothetical protein